MRRVSAKQAPMNVILSVPAAEIISITDYAIRTSVLAPPAL
jgi:hypothetical protein